MAEIRHDFRVDVTAALPPEVAGGLSGKGQGNRQGLVETTH
ncbi:MAG TPA: hypothetical protein VJ347_13185 [Streptosporangiaceae bacterium]|nr:hypothetical protein [Streptosporangiaceae bacterium]